MGMDRPPLNIGVLRETFPGERRVAMVPASLPLLTKVGLAVLVERGAGAAAGFADEDYAAKGATLGERSDIFSRAQVLLQVRALGANPQESRRDLPYFQAGQSLIGLCDPLAQPALIEEAARGGIQAFALELLPRITKAQSMDVLSSMATVAGYKAVLLAAQALPKMFPMLMTAAGTITPARVLVIGAGVAGLQAISTAKRLGAVVQAYDVRPAVKEQIQSLGAKFVELPLETGAAEGQGGYAREMDEEFYRRQRELLTRTLAETDAVISTAAVPGKKAPLLITAPMVAAMPRGSVIVDLAAERGGNCQLTRPGQTVAEQGVTVIGPLNLSSEIPFHASQMFARNSATFLLHLLSNGALDLERDDQIIRDTLLCRGGKIVQPAVAQALTRGEKP